MMDLFPPLFGEAPPLTCTRVGCNKDALHHIVWTADCDNGLACDEHMAEARRLWVFFGAHPYTLTCSMPGALYVFDENRCVMPAEIEGEDNEVVAALGS